jgi:PAS domain S-box-containing protein
MENEMENKRLSEKSRPFHSGNSGAEERRQRKWAEEARTENETLLQEAQEVAQQKQAQERLREQAALLDETQDAILVLGRDCRLRYCNRSAQQLYGLPPGEPLGQDAARLLFPENPHRCAEVCQMTLERRTWSEEIHHTTALGALRVMLSRWSLIHDAADQLTSFLVVNTDVTEHKRLQEQFLRAQRMDSIGTLASGIAHDLNNNLTPILMGSELMRETARNAEELELVAMIQQSARRGADIVRQLLQFGRGTDGERAEFQPAALLKEIAKVARSTFPKNLEIQQLVPEDLWSIRAVPTQIHQVLLNLCVNARDAMPGGGTLTLSAENLVADAPYATMNPEAKPGPYVVLQISDTGAGIPPDILEHIFDPFFTTKEQGKGTGLGLSTVLGIVKSHGGFVRVNSRVGEGTQFKVYLPALAEPAAPRLATANAAAPRGHGELVLVVDDEEAIRGVAQAALELQGYRMVSASDGAEALFTLSRSREPFQAVVTDMLMPVMDGAALIRALRHHAPNLPIIAMSGLAEQEAVASQAGRRIDAFLPKPFSAEELLRAVNKTLSQRAVCEAGGLAR